jgi:hypothetical protein
MWKQFMKLINYYSYAFSAQNELVSRRAISFPRRLLLNLFLWELTVCACIGYCWVNLILVTIGPI